MEGLSPILTAFVGLVTGGTLLQISRWAFDVLRRRQVLGKTGQEFINAQYGVLVEQLQQQVTHLRDQAGKIDRAYQDEIKGLLKQVADLRVENATLLAENGYLHGKDHDSDAQGGNGGSSHAPATGN